MLLAELEIRHSRAVAPTRRVALGERWLPTDPAPGYGGILLGGIVATHLGDVDAEFPDLDSPGEHRRFRSSLYQRAVRADGARPGAGPMTWL